MDTLDKYLLYISKNALIVTYSNPVDMDFKQYKSQYEVKIKECKKLPIEDINTLFLGTTFKLLSTSYGICNIVTHVFIGYTNFWLSYDTYKIKCIMKMPCVYSNNEYTFRELYNNTVALEVWSNGNKYKFDIIGVGNTDNMPVLLYMKENVLVDMISIN